MSQTLWQMSFIRPGTLSPRAFSFFSDLDLPGQLAGSSARKGDPDTGDWTFFFLFEDRPDLQDMATRIRFLAEIDDLEDTADLSADALSLRGVEPENWLEKSYAGFPPFSVGSFFFYGRHHETPEIPEGHTPIRIDAVTAFGSGEHPTTQGCLRLVDRLNRRGFKPARTLDMGTGSGILAIAAWKLWETPVLAVDNDPESVRVAAEYRDLNAVPNGPAGMTCALGNTPDDPAIIAAGPYDLVLANILAGPLIEMSGGLAARTAPKGKIILSGLLARQQTDVLNAFESAGCRLMDSCPIGDWTALLLQKI